MYAPNLLDNPFREAHNERRPQKLSRKFAHPLQEQAQHRSFILHFKNERTPLFPQQHARGFDANSSTSRPALEYLREVKREPTAILLCQPGPWRRGPSTPSGQQAGEDASPSSALNPVQNPREEGYSQSTHAINNFEHVRRIICGRLGQTEIKFLSRVYGGCGVTEVVFQEERVLQ